MPGRNRAWADTLIDVGLVDAAAQQSSDLLANAPVTDTITVVRILVDLYGFFHTPSPTVVGAQAIDVGIGVTSFEAFTANATPDVNTDNEYPPRGWLYLTRAVIARYPEEASEPVHIQADVRSMRRVDKGKLFIALANNSVDGIVQGIHVVGRVRVLCLT